MSRQEQTNFFAAHWEKLVLVVSFGALAAAGVIYALAIQVDPATKASEEARAFDSRKRGDCGVKEASLRAYEEALKAPKAVPRISDAGVEGRGVGNYLISGRRVFCGNCQCAIVQPKTEDEPCPFCRKPQPSVKAIVLDTDGDGFDDEYEKKYGLNPNLDDRNLDLDGDGFTNLEEFEAKTEPNNPKSHPSYTGFIYLELPLLETKLPFYFVSAQKTPAGYRYQFRDPKKLSDSGTKGRVYSVLEGEEIGKTGFIAKSYEEKMLTKKIAGGSGATKEVNASKAVIERKSDGKKVELGINEKQKPLDQQAKLVFTRAVVPGEGVTTKEFVVMPGDVIDINGSPYSVIKFGGKASPSVTIRCKTDSSEDFVVRPR